MTKASIKKKRKDMEKIQTPPPLDSTSKLNEKSTKMCSTPPKKKHLAMR